MSTTFQLAAVNQAPTGLVLKLGLSPLRWWTLSILGVAALVLLITHIVVLANYQSQVPSQGDTPMQPVAITNVVFATVLLIGTGLAISDVGSYFKLIQKSIASNPRSRWEDPLAIDETKISSIQIPQA